MEDTQSLLQQILVAQVLTLAGVMKYEAERKGTHSTSDYVNEAAGRIRQHSARILPLLK